MNDYIVLLNNSSHMKRTKCLVALLATLSVGLSASAQTTAPKNATVLEFVGTPYTALPAGTDGSVGTASPISPTMS